VKHGKITPQGGPQVTPVVYLDTLLPTFNGDIHDSAIWPNNKLDSYPNILHVINSVAVNEGGDVMCRLEGPVDEMAAWMGERYGAEGALARMTRVKLAR
jgi:hypothetical protein